MNFSILNSILFRVERRWRSFFVTLVSSQKRILISVRSFKLLTEISSIFPMGVGIR